MFQGLFSVKTSTRDDRCFVCEEGAQYICLNPACKDARALFVTSSREHEFGCKHTKLAANSVQPESVLNLSEEKIDAYNCDSATKAALRNVMRSIPEGLSAAYKVTEKNHAVYGPPSATNTVGYCHVKREESTSQVVFKCTGKECQGYVSKGKQEKTRTICIHQHALFCCLEMSKNRSSRSATVSTTTESTPLPCSSSSESQPPTSCTTVVPDTSTESTSLPCSSSSENQPPNSSSASKLTCNPTRASTLRLYGDKKLPYLFSSELLTLIKRKDAQTFLGLNEGWPNLFEVEDLACGVCGNPLGPSKLHPGGRGSSILYTNLNPFKEIVIKVRECTGNTCKAMHRVFPTEEGKKCIILYTRPIVRFLR